VAGLLEVQSRGKTRDAAANYCNVQENTRIHSFVVHD
jgi:hypothetical protein